MPAFPEGRSSRDPEALPLGGRRHDRRDRRRFLTDPPDYSTARAWFLGETKKQGFRLESFPIGLTGPTGEELAIDAAILGSEQPERVLILSSGLHGVEGFFGSAVQLAFLKQGMTGHLPGRNDALILLHALNPFGFAWVRRFNEENVDLNRNLLLDGEAYQGSPFLYGQS